MKEYKVSSLNFISNLQDFCERNFISISQSITTIITAINVNRSRIGTNTLYIENTRLNAWTTTNRPAILPVSNYIGINTTTNKLNHTIDGGTTWYNADGTAA